MTDGESWTALLNSKMGLGTKTRYVSVEPDSCAVLVAFWRSGASAWRSVTTPSFGDEAARTHTHTHTHTHTLRSHNPHVFKASVCSLDYLIVLSGTADLICVWLSGEFLFFCLRISNLPKSPSYRNALELRVQGAWTWHARHPPVAISPPPSHCTRMNWDRRQERTCGLCRSQTSSLWGIVGVFFHKVSRGLLTAREGLPVLESAGRRWVGGDRISGMVRELGAFWKSFTSLVSSYLWGWAVVMMRHISEKSWGKKKKKLPQSQMLRRRRKKLNTWMLSGGVYFGRFFFFFFF